ncbi:MAG: hypothetical protein ABIO70_00560 [Pseudomonadota bacterium]
MLAPALFLAMASTTTHAAPLVWSWEVGQTRSWHVEITRQRVDGDWHRSARNLEARATETNLAVDMVCEATEALKVGWELDCRFPEVALSGIAMPGEEDALREIFAEYRGLLLGAVAHVEVKDTGRVRSFDLDAMVPATAREAEEADCLRMLMMRPFALLELELPKGGDAKGRAWKQGGSPLLIQLRTSYGTVGGVIIEHKAVSSAGARVEIDTQGHGTVAYGLAMESDGAKTIALEIAGHATFDAAAGALLSREAMMTGRFTAGGAGASPADHFREIGSLQAIEATPEAPAAEP